MNRLYILVAILFSIGLLAGIYFRRSKAALAAAMLLLFLLPCATYAQHTHGEKAMHGPGKFLESTGGFTLSVTLTPGHGTVGKITPFDVTLLDRNKKMVNQPVYFEFQTVNAEDNVDVFHGVVRAPQGKTRQALQFSDGANHIVNVRAYLKKPGGSSVKPVVSFSKEIEVETYQPPKPVIAKTLFYFLCVLGIGVAAGDTLGKAFNKKQ